MIERQPIDPEARAFDERCAAATACTGAALPTAPSACREGSAAPRRAAAASHPASSTRDISRIADRSTASGRTWNTSNDVARSKMPLRNGISPMLACATRWPCAWANSVPMRVRSKPTARAVRAAASRGSSRFRSRNRGCAARGHPRWRARARASCTGGSRETRSAIVPRGTSARVSPVIQPAEKCRDAILPSHMRFRGSVEATAVVLGAVILACVFTYPVHLPVQQRGPARHQRRALEHLGRVVGGARADDGSAAALPRQHLLSAHQCAGLLGRQSRRRPDRRADLGADEEPVHDPQLRVPLRVRAVVRRDLLPGAASHRRSTGGGDLRASCSPTARSRSCARRTSSC